MLNFLKKKTIIYSDLQYGENFQEHMEQRKKLIELIYRFLESLSEENCILIEYNHKWIINDTLSQQIKSLFIESNISNNFDGGILCKKGELILKLFIEAIFMYNSFFNIVIPHHKVIITPTDHMDIFFDFINSQQINNLIQNISRKLGFVVEEITIT